MVVYKRLHALFVSDISYKRIFFKFSRKVSFLPWFLCHASVWLIPRFRTTSNKASRRPRGKGHRRLRNIRDFKIHYGGLLLRLLRPWGTRLTTTFPPQTSNRLRFRCTATGCSISTCLYKNGYVRLYSAFIRQRLDQWQWFPSLVLILHHPELKFASQLLLEPPVIPTTKQNNTDKKLDFSTGRVFDQSENTKFLILIKYIVNSST